MRRMRSVLVSAWIGSTNLGDELVFSSLLRKLRRRDLDVVVVSVDPEATRLDHGARAVGHVDVRGLGRLLGRVDAVILGGGGLLQDSTSPFNVPYHLARPLVARLRHRPVGAVGIGAGPLEHAATRWMVRHGLHRVHPITVRDEPSRALLARLGIAATATADLAFGLDPPSRVETHCLVACLRPWSAGRHLLPAGVRARRTETPDWFVAGAARALDDAAAGLGLPVRFVALQRDRDHPLHEAVAARMRTPVSLVTPGVGDVLDEIARGAVVVSMRYHGVVGATLAGRPTVAIGYSPKVDALAGELGAAAQVVPWSAEGMAAVAGAASRVAGRDGDAVTARHELQERERGNDAAIDELLTR